MTDLLDLTEQLVAVPSESFHEGDLADLVQRRLEGCPHLEVHRIEDNVVARTLLGRPIRVLLGGHLDTVPANGNATPVRRGDVLWGLGSADMKGGLAVMLDLAESVTNPAVDVTYVFYAREEVSFAHSGLLEIERLRPDLLSADVALLGEPTGGQVEAGCQGTLRMRLVLAGKRAHTARAWMGVNAIHRAGPLVTEIASWEPRQPVIDNCRFREALQVVEISGGVAGNVIPDEVSLLVAHRFAPDRTPAQAEHWLRGALAPFLTDSDSLELLDSAPGAPPGLTHPVLAALIGPYGLSVTAKLGWTDVSFFAARGIPAANLGPGDATLAHTAEERVHRDDLHRVSSVLTRLLAGEGVAGRG